MAEIIRALAAADVPACFELSSAAGWNQTEADWRNVIQLAPRGCFGVELDGVIASTTTTYLRPDGIAWIGMVLTRADCRGRGYATQLVEAAHAYLESRGIRRMGLDATDQGRPIYLRLGYAGYCPIERWLRLPAPASPAEAGIAIGRPGRTARYFGPCRAASESEARRSAALYVFQFAGEPILWDLFPFHPAARIAASLGFSPLRRLTRMYRGGAPEAQDPGVFAIAGFEFG